MTADPMPPTSPWQLPPWPAVPHGGAGPGGALPHDFSTNRNAAGPLPSVWRAVQQADRRVYPDAGYHCLRQHLADWHGVAADRVLVLASASAFIHSFTQAAKAWRGVQRVAAPMPGYGDYAAAAQRAGLALDASTNPSTNAAPNPSTTPSTQPAPPDAHTLCWWTEPHSPSGTAGGAGLSQALAAALAAGAVTVLDLAYQPLRLDGACLPTEAQHAWQLWSPNKAAGLTGARAAYAVAPPGQAAVVQALQAAGPSWPVGAEGVALLSAFTTPQAQAELAACRRTLLAWRQALVRLLQQAGWVISGDNMPTSVTPFLLARPARPWDAARAAAHGVQLRDATSLGLPGAWRINALGPASLAVLGTLLQHATNASPNPAMNPATHPIPQTMPQVFQP